MAIPTGKTSGQLEWLARWALAGMMILGEMSWWWPGYHSWGSAVAGLAVVLVLWLSARIVAGETTVPGHPVHFVMLVPAGILAVHLARHAAGVPKGSHIGLNGSIDISMIYWLCLLSLGVMLTQSLLPRAARHTAVLGSAGAAMMLGPAAAIIAGPTAPVRTALALLGFAGVGVWLTMLWGLGSGQELESAPDAPPASLPDHNPTKRLLRVACVAVAAIAAGALAITAPLQGLLVLGIAAASLFVAGLVFPGGRVWLLLAGGAGAATVAGVLAMVDWIRSALVDVFVQAAHASWFGRGEQAFRSVSASDNGLAVLLGMVGWVGALWFIGVMALCLVWMLCHARRGRRGDKGRAVVWSISAGCAVAALIAPGGLFIPAAALGAVFVLGLLPVMLGRPKRSQTGLMLLAAFGAMVVMLGLAPNTGLFSWSLGHFGRIDTILHVSMGFLIALLLAWQFGTRRIWMGLAAIAVGAMLGGPAEVIQYLISYRTAELRDWLHHAMGSACVLGPYLLCMLARWSESPDARRDKPNMAYGPRAE